MRQNAGGTQKDTVMTMGEPDPEREPWGLRLSRLQQRRMIRTVCGVCELCHQRYPARLLSIHQIDRCAIKRRDIQRIALVLCILCSEHIRRAGIPPSRFTMLVEDRSFLMRQRMRRAAGYVFPTVYLPDAPDLAAIFEEATRPGSPSSYRLAG
jgi:hypothetical protein